MAAPMTPNDLPPIPPELAADEPYLPTEVVEAIVSDLLHLTAEQAIDMADAAEHVALTNTDRFVVDDRAKAEWAMAHVAKAQAALDALTEQRDAYLARIHSWFERDAKRHAATIAFFSEHLQRYVLLERARDPKTKTIDLPNGRISTRKVNEAAEVVNEDAVLAWLRGLPAEQREVAVTEKVRVTGLRSLVTITADGTVVSGDGEVVPGTAVRPAGVSVSVKPT